MFSTDDTIVAIATPPGRGGIGIVRVDGPDALTIGRALTGAGTFEPRRATFTRLAVDQVIVTFFPAPHSYTGGDVVEIAAHGSPVVLEGIVRSAVAAGARLARPGEFTLRAYLNGRMDLVQAEAVADLIDAATPLQASVAFDQLEGTLTDRIRALDAGLTDLVARLEASLDFPDEGYHFITPEELVRGLAATDASLTALLTDAARGRIIRDGVTVAIVGRPNVGKSSLFNRLAGASRAIVTDVPGTTRDVLAERVDVDGIETTIVDTAGLRAAAADAIEEEGIVRARRAFDTAHVLLVVLDRSVPLTADDERLLVESAGRPHVIAASKCDLPAAWDAVERAAIPVSALTDAGAGELRRALARAAGVEELRDRPAIANARHASLVGQARERLRAAAAAAGDGLSEEFVLQDLHAARAAFDEITGVRAPDELLEHIFSRFCIGK